MNSKSSLCFLLFAVFLASATVTLGDHYSTDPQKVYEQCQKQCDRQSEGGRQYSREVCDRRCEDWLRERHQHLEEEQPGRDGGESEEEVDQNPYVFEDQHFVTDVRTRHGRVRILQKFTDGPGSTLLRRIENYRLSMLEAEPKAFILPSYWDADILAFVANGKGTVSMVKKNEQRESINVKEGDIFGIRAGTTTYMINRHNSERLIIVKLVIPVSIPGHFKAFFGPGGGNPESFYKAFSNEILQAAFNTRKDRLQRLFGQQKQGAIIEASEEQIRAMSRHREGGVWPFGGESKAAFNIYEEGPRHHNKYGQQYEVDSAQYKPLHRLNVDISFANISQGAMNAPYYNSRATKIVVVVNGEGYFEMACPHLSSKQSSQERPGSQLPRYWRASSRLRRGTVVVVPAGHPFVAVASNDRNLQLLCFEVNADENEKFLLTGKSNVMKQLEKEAKELAFGLPEREVDGIFNSQNEDHFFPGPLWHQKRQDLLADA